ncbi:hypothetical protein FGO68_gene5375 [Halteria grandinella]|uniref:Uncharacterized protein n=1 Tax=Halteria grandinella TaxID=5974 RepID=A0A8J8SVU4_HALGN|nr:hypothetical protein FGO68_gene5375 [Halteria grandinella]
MSMRFPNSYQVKCQEQFRETSLAALCHPESSSPSNLQKQYLKFPHSFQLLSVHFKQLLHNAFLNIVRGLHLLNILLIKWCHYSKLLAPIHWLHRYPIFNDDIELRPTPATLS